jgi:glycerol-3-phosphate dehydrogenase
VGLLTRDEAFGELSRRRFDLLVVGAGIIGAGIAAEAARHGLSVALVDRRDFGAATSSASSKLVHGGLRYLRLGDVRLVREAHAERRTLLDVVAPHLVQRLPFLLPVYEGGPYRPATVRAALWLYATLARERVGGLVAPERASRSVPDLRLDGLRACGVFADALTHDARLCLANVRAAANAGATVANYAEVTALRIANGRVGGAQVGPVSVAARAVVNATGPWVDAVRRLEDPRAGTSVRLSKGVHAVLPLERRWTAGLAIPHDRVRLSFAVPWQGMLLVGTTDTLYEGDPAAVRVDEEDLATVLAEAATAVDGALGRDAVRHAFAGLRVLPFTGRDTASARRETILSRGPAGMLTIAGGKLTTYRRIALAALRALQSDLGLHRILERPVPLPGATDLPGAAARLARRFPELDPAVRAHLLHLYGSLVDEVLAGAEEQPELLRPVDPRAPDLVAQMVYAREREWAVRLEDVTARRTTLAVHGVRLDPASPVAGGLTD